MKTINSISISVLLLAVFVLMSFSTPQKQVNKVVSKVWKGEVISVNEINLPDSLGLGFTYLTKISINNEIVGYACYSTAFGCRIGGCAAPDQANADTYETFDYIIVYDTQLSIIKVDIADYPGAYGYEICRSKWLRQFEGKTTGFKLNENIDGISGATVSATYLIRDINAVGTTIKKLGKSGEL